MESRSALQEDVSNSQLITVDKKKLSMISIPPEIRIMIFEYVIPFEESDPHSAPDEIKAFRTKRTQVIYQDALSVWFKRTIFIISSLWHFRRWMGVRCLAELRNRGFIGQIQTLDLHLHSMHHNERHHDYRGLLKDPENMRHAAGLRKLTVSSFNWKRDSHEYHQIIELLWTCMRRLKHLNTLEFRVANWDAFQWPFSTLIELSEWYPREQELVQLLNKRCGIEGLSLLKRMKMCPTAIHTPILTVHCWSWEDLVNRRAAFK